MRKQPERGFYVKDGAIVHAKVCPDGAREIMPAEAQAIRSARPRQKPVMPSLPANADAGMMEALGVLVDAVERLDAKNRELAAKLESVIDVTHTTDVRGE